MQVFMETLGAIRDGELVKELEVQLRDLVDAVRTTNKSGRLQITLKLTPHKGGLILLDDDHKTTRPEPEKDTSTVFFPTESNDLSRRDPRQPSLLPERPRVVSMAQASEGGQS